MTNTNNRVAGQKTSLQRAAQAVGAVFLLISILGFIPGVTSNYDALAEVGHGSGALLLGVLQVSVLHKVVHLLFGVAGLLMARSRTQAKASCFTEASSTWSSGFTGSWSDTTLPRTSSR